MSEVENGTDEDWSLRRKENATVRVCAGGGFVLTCEDLGRMFNHSFLACAFFSFEAEISLCTRIPLFMPGSVHSDLRQLWLTVPWQSYLWASFQVGSHICLDSGIVSPHQLHWVKGVRVLNCNLPPALLAEWPGSFTCLCGNTGVEWTLNKSHHTNLTLEKKILTPTTPAGIRTHNLSNHGPALTNKLSRLWWEFVNCTLKKNPLCFEQSSCLLSQTEFQWVQFKMVSTCTGKALVHFTPSSVFSCRTYLWNSSFFGLIDSSLIFSFLVEVNLCFLLHLCFFSFWWRLLES